jgi:hypothetical protein
VSLLAACCGTAFAQPSQPVSAQSSQPKWLPYVDFEARPGNKRSLSEADIFQPLAQTDSTLLFADLRGRLDDQDSREGNVGLGLRHMLSRGWNLGVYGYYDRRRSSYGNYFNQATFGGELLGRDWDFRANAYLPFGRRVQDADSLNTAELSGTTVVFHGGEERALRGFDAEVGWRVPLWSYDADKVLRVYAGGFHFSDGTEQDVTGPRFRVDLTMLQVPHLWEGARLTLGGEVEHDNVRGTQLFGVVRLRVPLSAERPAVKLTAQERRMLAHVERDVDVVSQAGAFGPAETVTETAGGQRLSVVSSASTSGANLPTAVANAGADSVVILSGTFNTTAKTTLASGQTLMGAGTLMVRAPDGRTARLTTPAATISYAPLSGSNQAMTLANNSTVTGLNVSVAGAAGFGANGILASGVTGATVSNNTITASGTGSGSSASGVGIVTGASVTVRNNTIIATAPPGQTQYAVGVANASATVTGNRLSATNGATNYYVFLGNANIGTGSSGNTVGSGSCSVVSAGTGSTVTFTNAAPCGP